LRRRLVDGFTNMDTVKYLLKSNGGISKTQLREARLYIGREKRLEEAEKSGRYRPTALARSCESIWELYEILEERQRIVLELRRSYEKTHLQEVGA